MKNRKRLILVVSIIVILLVTLGASVAIFSFAQNSNKEHSIVMGDIKFKYTEITGVGNGINIEDAEPISDTNGKVLNNYFDFKVEADLIQKALTYQVVVEPTANTTMNLNGVKLYLTEVNNNVETPISQTIADNGKVKNLSQYENTNFINQRGKMVYLERIPEMTRNYEKHFRARMWINEDIEWDSNGYIGTTAAFRINVYVDNNTTLDALHLTYSSKINPDTNQPYTTCTNIQCAIDELFSLASE